MSPDCALCCAGPRAAASDDAGREQRDGSIFSREGEKVFSHLADAASKRERLHRFCSGIERVLPQAAGRLAAHAETGGRAAAPRGEAVAAGAAARARKAARQRFARRSRASSPVKCTAFALVAGAGYPQRPAAGGRSPVDCTAFRVSPGGGLSTTRSGRPSSGSRRSPFKSTGLRVDAEAGYPHPPARFPPIRRRRSPVECTGLRVDWAGAIVRSGVRLAMLYLLPARQARKRVGAGHLGGSHTLKTL